MKITTIKIEMLDPTPFNAERSARYNEAALATLAANVAELQVIEPLIVRKAAGKRYEIVAGERRWRACKIAGKLDVPCVVRELTDRQVCDLMVSENLHREDMDPVQEAAVYSGLLKARDQDGNLIYPNIKDLTEVTGRTSKEIWRKIKMLNCPAFVLDALSDGRISARVVQLLGQIPTESEREKAARRALHCKYREGPMTVEEVQEMIKNEFMISLAGVPFDQNDAELVGEIREDGVRIAGGACVDCPARTGNMPALLELLASGGAGDGGAGSSAGVSPRVCTRPTCFHEKCTRAWREEERQAELAGHRVMPTESGLSLLAGWDADLGVYLSNKVRYVDRADRPGHCHTGHFGNDALPTWEELLTGEKISWILVREGRKRRYFLESEIAVEMADLLRAQRGDESLFARKVTKLQAVPAPRELEPVERKLMPMDSVEEVLRKNPKLAPAVPDARSELVEGETLVDEVGDDEEAIRAMLPIWAETVWDQAVEGLSRDLAVMALTSVLNSISVKGQYLVWEILEADPNWTVMELVEAVSANQPTRVVETVLAQVLTYERVVMGEIPLVESSDTDEGAVARDPVICEIEGCDGVIDDGGLCEGCGWDHSAQPSEVL